MNISFEIGTRLIYPTDTNETLLEDVNDGVEARAQNHTHETGFKDVKDGIARAQNEDRNGKLQDIHNGKNHEVPVILAII